MNSTTLISRTEIKSFNPDILAAGIFALCNNKILLAQINTHKEETGYWGVPGGKVEKNETMEEAARREFHEECGVILPQIPLPCISKLWVKKPHLSYRFDTFFVEFTTQPKLIPSEEHEVFCWYPLDKLNTVPLMTGGREIIEDGLKYLEVYQ